MKAITRKELLQGFKIIVLACVLGVGIGTVQAVWTPPAGSPPTCPDNTPGCEAPLHTGTDGQTKEGGLSVALGQPLGNLGFAVLNGNVGIGTGAPAAKLHVSGGINQPGGSYAAIRLTDTAVTNATWELIAQTNNTKMFRVYDVSAGVDRLSINSLGNVGIGTQAPVEKLEVNGNAKASGFCLPGSAPTGGCITSWGGGGGGGSEGTHFVYMSNFPGSSGLAPGNPTNSMGPGSSIVQASFEGTVSQGHVWRVRNLTSGPIGVFVNLFVSGVPEVGNGCSGGLEKRTAYAPMVFYTTIAGGQSVDYNTAWINPIACELNSSIQVTAEKV